MAELTRGDIIDRVANILGDDSTDFRTHMNVSFNNMLYFLFDMHDWDWKHKSGTFTTSNGTADYIIPTVATLTDFRSCNDIEVMWDVTAGRFLRKEELRDIRSHYPEMNVVSTPTHFGVWNQKTITLHPTPNGTDTIDFLYVATATEATGDTSKLTTDLGIPPYMFYLFEKLCLAEGMLYYDDDRRNNLLEEIEKLWKPRAIEADMKHLESGTRFKFWEEELRPYGLTFEDFLRKTWWSDPAY